MDTGFTALVRGLEKREEPFIVDGTRCDGLHALAGQLAACFRELDPVTPICLLAQSRAIIAASLLAAAATGRVLALPHSFSARALRQLQEITGFTAAVMDVDRELQHGIEVISTQTVARQAPLALSDCRPTPDKELLKLFTGGSTGAARIWSKTTGNLFGEARFMAARYRIEKEDIILATITPYHIYGLLFSVLIPLFAGARVVGDSPSFPAEISDSVSHHKATILATVPAHYRALNGRGLHSSLRLAFSSAGMLPEEDNQLFYRKNNVPVVEIYGSTETGGLASRNRAAGEVFFTPLPPVQWKIEQERLYVQSPFLSPDIETDQGGWFLSGDRVHQQDSNSFSLHGRADAVTKVAGERVDLDEIRELLQQQAGVAECVVIPLPDSSGRGNRIAALVRGEQDPLDLAPIKLVLSVTLEPAAMPKKILVVPQIPITANGKYDREAIMTLLS